MPCDHDREPIEPPLWPTHPPSGTRITVRFVLPDGANTVHATTHGPADLDEQRRVRSLCGLTITVPQQPGTRRLGPDTDTFCAPCTLRYSAITVTHGHHRVTYRLPGEGFH